MNCWPLPVHLGCPHPLFQSFTTSSWRGSLVWVNVKPSSCFFFSYPFSHVCICFLCDVVFLTSAHVLCLSIFLLATCLIFFSFFICVCAELIVLHILSTFLLSTSVECWPTVGYYCLIKGRLGRRRPDKSIKLPLTVPEGRWIEMDFVPARESPRVHLPNGVRGCIC